MSFQSRFGVRVMGREAVSDIVSLVVSYSGLCWECTGIPQSLN